MEKESNVLLIKRKKNNVSVSYKGIIHHVILHKVWMMYPEHFEYEVTVNLLPLSSNCVDELCLERHQPSKCRQLSSR